MMLDFDENAINKKLQIISDESQEQPVPWFPSEMRKNFLKPSKRVEPFPGACIKTWTTSGDKVFINVCHSKEIHPPNNISEEELCQMMEGDPTFIIPMAIGIEKMAKTKDGIERSTFDILINTKYFEKCMKKSLFWKFTIAVFLGSINDKYNKLIDTSKYVVLKNCKVMGSLDTFNIEDREPRKPIIKKPLIEVVKDQENDNLLHKKIINRPNTKDQNYFIVKSDNGENLIGFFYCPSFNITDIIIDVAENRITVENHKVNCMIDVFIPHCIDCEHSTAIYDSKLHILRLIMPLKNKELS